MDKNLQTHFQIWFCKHDIGFDKVKNLETFQFQIRCKY